MPGPSPRPLRCWTEGENVLDRRTVAILRELWAQGLSASQIAARLGAVSRNAVIGKAHRLGLEGRPSPIRGGAGGRRRARGARMTPTPTLSGTRVTKTDEELAADAAGLPAARLDAPPFAAPAPRAEFETGTDGRMCLWPIGDPGEPGFHFCGRPAAVGRPYCADHCSVAYIRRERAA